MSNLFDTSLSAVDKVNDPLLELYNVQLYLKRDDLIDPVVSGNKWRKLKFNVLQCQQNKSAGILTFGGAYSNHLVATASACKKARIKSVGIVRGDELNPKSNATLSTCQELGMHLHFISREEYHLRDERYYHEELLQEFPNLHVVPEGGANYYGFIGCQELVGEISIDFDRIVVAQGTTTTSCGLALGLKGDQKLTVVPALKGFKSEEEMIRLFNKSGVDSETTQNLLERTTILDQYHFGGYAKYDDSLLDFIENFHEKHGVKLDPVYTGKAMFALYDQLISGTFANETIVFVHTGGLQGIPGIERSLGRKLFVES